YVETLLSTPVFLHHSLHHRDLPSFPTRRSSDLWQRWKRRASYSGAKLEFSFADVTGLLDIWSTRLEQGLKEGAASEHELEILLRSEEHTSELQSRGHLVCRLLLEKKKEYDRMRI